MQSATDTPMGRAIREAYARGEEDETMPALHLVDATGAPMGLVDDGDSVIFYNIRGEREIELSLSLTQPGFSEFPTKDAMTVRMATMIEYDPRITDHVAFPAQHEVTDTLSQVVSAAGLRQAKVVESEKAVHITYFLNGKLKDPLPGEERVIIESNREVNDFDELPQMNVAEVADATIARLQDPACTLIVANFANMDVVGHIEDKAAVLRAIEAVDQAVGRVVRAAQEAGVVALVTADHGTVEKWYYPDGKVDTGHTNSQVPFVAVGAVGAVRQGGNLTDVAPTVLNLLGLNVPEVMTGRPLVSVGQVTRPLAVPPVGQVTRPLVVPPVGQAAGPSDDETGLVTRPTEHRVLLLIADGWGLNDDASANLITQANTPNLDWLLTHFPWAPLQASGRPVGMPDGTVGNSEAGHLHIGAGRTVPSDRLRIADAISDGSFRSNPAFNWAIDEAARGGNKLHLLGIISFYSSHGSVQYLEELLRLCAERGVRDVYIHGLLGRRGERPESGAAYVADVEKLCADLGVGRVVSVIGRHWALDREEHWERVEKAYRLLAFGEGLPVGGAA